jgi:hypothetical protein
MCIAYGKAMSESYSTKEEKAAALNALHTVYAPETLRIVLEMKGYYIKAAQMMCGVGMLPGAFEDELKVLLDDVPPRPTALIKSIIEEELGSRVDEVFETFRDEPIGCASIGQVHLATLKGSAQKVVVKVQYPEVEAFFRLDLLTIKFLCGCKANTQLLCCLPLPLSLPVYMYACVSCLFYLSCLATPYHTLPCPCPALPCPALPCPALPYCLPVMPHILPPLPTPF